MSTQQGPSIDFYIAQNLTNFQLVELPDELVTLIANHKAQDAPVLQLKSEAQTGNAVLCTPSSTFPLRSVQTSNSLFVVQPASSQCGDEDAVPPLGIKVISTCGATLELSKSKESALPYLRKGLPVYTSRDLNAAAAVKQTFDDVCRNVPMSDGEVQIGWTALCAFEEQGASFRPSAAILLELWTAIKTAAIADDINITSAFLIEDLWITIRDEDFPRGLFDAFLRRIGEEDMMDGLDADAGSRWCTINKSRFLELLAALILETRTTGTQAITTADFTALWQAQVPDQWHIDLSLDLIQNLIQQPTSTTLILKPDLRLAGLPASTSEASETNAPSKKGKWHEKFKKTRT